MTSKELRKQRFDAMKAEMQKEKDSLDLSIVGGITCSYASGTGISKVNLCNVFGTNSWERAAMYGGKRSMMDATMAGKIQHSINQPGRRATNKRKLK